MLVLPIQPERMAVVGLEAGFAHALDKAWVKQGLALPPAVLQQQLAEFCKVPGCGKDAAVGALDAALGAIAV